ncbi:MAG: hypothetical protein M0Z77_11985 [Thermoplasmatales archaeon]|nr:hypothetical protein [Candidatus Thermoplasmatota archaeon]MCL6003403.1 hypothetical protein [Candidatus Thermoplasmatota archaeon]MDA8056349.1 hypothetical protein [Thermoplasmatales archaeon]
MKSGLRDVEIVIAKEMGRVAENLYSRISAVSDPKNEGKVTAHVICLMTELRFT